MTATAKIAPNARYQVHTDKGVTHLVVDTANGSRPVSDSRGPLVWGNTDEDKAMAFHYAVELNKLRTVAEIREGR